MKDLKAMKDTQTFTTFIFFMTFMASF